MIKIRRKKPRKLDLCSKDLKIFPSEVFADKKISRLDMSNNHITEIPVNIGDLVKLRYLHLENNNITQLHNGILNTRSLRVLYLQGNPMKHLPDFIKENAKFSIYTDNEIFTYYPKVEIDYNKQILMKEIGSEVDSINNYDTIFKENASVPTVSNLTFSRHENRIGRSLTTCILFVDIRDSVKKNSDHRSQTLAHMYSSFIYGVLRIAKEYNGHVRNIIGDRVMIVFDEASCCDNAVLCAGTIMSFCSLKMGKTLPNDNFYCGIGIHYGNIDVIKVGLSVQGNENPEYQNLVWIGEPANLASRLTDKAGKDNIPAVVISSDVFKRLTNKDIIKTFVSVDKSKFKDIDFSVLGCNLNIK
jgi:class 3 adenylate cyclase